MEFINPVTTKSALTPISLKVVSEAGMVKGQQVVKVPRDALASLIMSIPHNHEEEAKPFYVLDLGDVIRLMEKWNQSFPTVKPFYAVKCNPESALLVALAVLGANFDCASQAEIRAILGLGIQPDRIIYANPCKSVSDIKYAANVGVNLTTFDSKEEVDKIKQWHPQCCLLLRIEVPNDKSSWNSLDSKFGAFPDEVVPLLQHAHQAGLEVLGVSFHIGYKSLQAPIWRRTIAVARSAFDAAIELKMPPMHLLNIGGGFKANPLFNDLATTINDLIQEYFPNKGSLKVIAEPGRYFAETAFTMVTNVIGKRVRGEQIHYWIDDGIHGSFNPAVYDSSSMEFKPLLKNGVAAAATDTSLSIVFGPTCNSSDIVMSKCKLPELQVNDLLVFSNMGAYTTSTASKFNGFNRIDMSTYLVYSDPN